MEVEAKQGEEAQPPRKSLAGVERTVRILHSLDADEELTLAAVARLTSLSEATALRYLGSLVSFGLVERTPSNRYRLGWEMFRLGQMALARRVPRSVVLPVLERLLERFNETVTLALRQGDELIVVEALHGSRAVKKVNEIGQRELWHASALGKAILSRMPDEERHAILGRSGQVRLTKNTIISIEGLDRDLEDSIRRGYTVDREEEEEGLTCVGAPVTSTGGAPVFAISVSFLTHRLESHEIESAGAAVRGAALELKQLLGYASPDGDA
jgi:IclR family acetate operon transcriptional repressor